VIALARALNLTVTAEGIEAHDQCDRLRDLGCDFAQGYVFSHPLEADEAVQANSADGIWLPNVSCTSPPGCVGRPRGPLRGSGRGTSGIMPGRRRALIRHGVASLCRTLPSSAG
jgi:hypothetical protein